MIKLGPLQGKALGVARRLTILLEIIFIVFSALNAWTYWDASKKVSMALKKIHSPIATDEMDFLLKKGYKNQDIQALAAQEATKAQHDADFYSDIASRALTSAMEAALIAIGVLFLWPLWALFVWVIWGKEGFEVPK